MLPGFRFLFAATLLTVSLLIFGLGAAALLRASHERFASLPKQPVPVAVLTQTADAAPPTLSMLRVEPAPVEARPDPVAATAAIPADTLSPTDRIATISVAPRTDEAPPAPPVIIEPKPDAKADIKAEASKVETKEAKIEPGPEPVTEQPVQIPPASGEARIATPVQAEPQAVATPEPATVAETPALISSEPSVQVAALPEPDITGSTPATQTIIDPPLVNARPIRRPPTPRDRPADADVVAALPDPAMAAPATDTAKPTIRKRRPAAKRAAKPKRRVVSRPAVSRPAVRNPAAPFGAPQLGT